MKKIKTITLLFFILICPSLYAESASDLVERGLIAYSKDGPAAAIEAWIKDSGLEGSKDALSQANVLKQVEVFYGEYESFEIIREHEISKRSKMIVFSMNYQKGILFGRFQAYKTSENIWVATEFDFGTEAASVIPVEMVFGK